MRRCFLAAVAGLVFVVPGATGLADSGARSYDYLVCDGFLSGVECKTEAAQNGDTMEIKVSGSFTIHSKSASGSGTFEHRDAAGNLLGSGTFTVTDLLSFHSFGDGTPQGLPSEFEGGKAVFTAELDPGAAGGPTFEAILEVVCALGNPPGHDGSGQSTDFFRLVIPAANLNFNKPIPAPGTLFIRTD